MVPSRGSEPSRANEAAGGEGLKLGLIFFSSRTEGGDGAGGVGVGDPYRLLLSCARFADRHGFSSLWVPERHFTPDGWLYPNPAVVAAALATETERIALRAGSVVVPLHHPVRIAEEWAVVDQLSRGRVGLSFASGWHPNDFVFYPERYADRHEHTYQGVETVRALWRGESVRLDGGRGEVGVRTFPRPVQPELPVWLTAAGNPKTFERAGEIGANLLTHLFNQTVDELGENIDIYRAARRRNGHDPATGTVTTMVHTFVTEDARQLDEQVRPAFCDYLKSASYLLDGLAASRGKAVDVSALSDQDVAEYVGFVYDRLVSTGRVLLGTAASCQEPLRRLRAAGVDEVACQVDFGPPVDAVLDSLPALDRVREWSAHLPAAPDRAAAALTAHPVPGVAVPADPVPVDAVPVDAVAAVRSRCSEEITGQRFYERLRQAGVDFGTGFQGVRRLWRRDGEALGEVELPSGLDLDEAAYTLHPALLDACLQVLVAALPRAGTGAGAGPVGLVLPVGLRRFEVFHRPGRRVFSHAVVTGSSSTTETGVVETGVVETGVVEGGVVEGDVRLLDEDGTAVATAHGVRLRTMAPPPEPARDSADDVFYETRWEPSPAPSLGVRPAGGRWLIFADGAGVADSLAAGLVAAGQHPVLVRPGTEFEAADAIADAGAGAAPWRIRPGSDEDMGRLVDAMASAGRSHAGQWQGVVHLWSVDVVLPDRPGTAEPGLGLPSDSMGDSLGDLVDDLARAQDLGCGSVLRFVRAVAGRNLAPRGATPSPRVWLVTRGAQRVVPDDATVAVGQAPLWGFGRALGYEHPELWGGLVDLDPSASPETNATALRRIVDAPVGGLVEKPATGHGAGIAEDEIALRQGERYVARLVRADVPAAGTVSPRCRPDGAYLLTGGLGDLGLLVARRLVDNGARHLVLLGRTGLPDRGSWHAVEPSSRLAERIRAVEELESLGVDVVTAAVDVGDAEAMSACLAQVSAEGRPPIRGVVHLAAEVRGGIALNLDDSALTDVFRPKVNGGWLLHQLLAGQDLDFFVLFSAIPATFGLLGQGATNYAAANVFLDALAAHRVAAGQPALSIGWGPWAELGLAYRTDRGLELLARQGVGALSSARGLDAFDRLMAGSSPHVVVASLDWPSMLSATPSLAKSPLLRSLPAFATAPVAQASGAQGAKGGRGAVTTGARASADHAVRDVLLALPDDEREDGLREYTRGVIAAVLEIAPDDLDVDVSLNSSGLDSLMAIELKGRLEDNLGVRVPMVAFLQGPSVRQLAAELSEQLTEQRPDADSQPDPAADLADVVARLPADVDQLSDSDVDAALSQFLNQ